VDVQEGDKETAGLQDQLARTKAEAAELQQALQISLNKQKEHEALVGDLSTVVAQQKVHIQVCKWMCVAAHATNSC
jgi:hypothetical protein